MAKNTHRGRIPSSEGKHDGCSFAALCCHVSRTCPILFHSVHPRGGFLCPLRCSFSVVLRTGPTLHLLTYLLS